MHLQFGCIKLLNNFLNSNCFVVSLNLFLYCFMPLSSWLHTWMIPSFIKCFGLFFSVLFIFNYYRDSNQIKWKILHFLCCYFLFSLLHIFICIFNVECLQFLFLISLSTFGFWWVLQVTLSSSLTYDSNQFYSLSSPFESFTTL